MSERIVVLGAGFGGLELSTLLSEALGDDAGVALIDRSDAFVFETAPRSVHRRMVFGGMGTWNDFYFEDESLRKHYERISSRLWRAVPGGLASACNAFRPSAS